MRLKNPMMPDLLNATVNALVGPQEGDDVAIETVNFCLNQDGVSGVLLFYDDNDNIACGVDGYSTAFQHQLQKNRNDTTLICINSPSVGADKKLQGTAFTLLDVCDVLGVHPQLLPLLAALILHDKSPGWPCIGNIKVKTVGQRAQAFLDAEENSQHKEELEKNGWTRPLAAAILNGLLDDGALPLQENILATQEKVLEIVDGVMDSVLGYPTFFKQPEQQQLLHRSQRGEILLEKVPGTNGTTYRESTEYTFQQALGTAVDLEFLLKDETADDIAKLCLQKGIQSNIETFAPHVTAMCLESTSSKCHYYINEYSRMSKLMNSIGRGAVRGLYGYETDSTGTKIPVLFLFRVINKCGYALTVIPFPENDTSGDADSGGGSDLGDAHAFADIPFSEEDILTTLATGSLCVANMAPLADGVQHALAYPAAPRAVVSPQSGAILPTSTVSTNFASDLHLNNEQDNLEDFEEYLAERENLNFGVVGIDHYQELIDNQYDMEQLFSDNTNEEHRINTGSPLYPSTGNGNVEATANVRNLLACAEKPRRALLILADGNGNNSLVLWNDSSSFPESLHVNEDNADGMLIQAIENAFAPVSRYGSRYPSTSVNALARCRIFRRIGHRVPFMCFSEHCTLGLAIRQLKTHRPDLFKENNLHLGVSVDNHLHLFRFYVPDCGINSTSRSQIRAYCDTLPDDVTCMEYGFDSDSHLIARSLTVEEANMAPWTVSFPGFFAAKNGDDILTADAALKFSHEMADQMLCCPCGPVLYEGSFLEAQDGRTEATMLISKIGNPFREAVSRLKPEGTFRGQSSTPLAFAVVLLPSMSLIVGKLAYDKSQENDLTMKFAEILLLANGITTEISDRIKLGVCESERYDTKIIAVAKAELFGADIPGFISLNASNIETEAKAAVNGSLVIGRRFERMALQKAMGGAGSLGMFKFGNRARGNFADAGHFGPLLIAILMAGRLPDHKKVNMTFHRPGCIVKSVVANFQIENDNQKRVNILKRENPGEIDFINKHVQIGIVSGSDPPALGLQVLDLKRKEAGDAVGSVPVAWEQRNFSCLEMIKLITNAMNYNVEDGELESILEWLVSNGNFENSEELYDVCDLE